VLLCLIPRLVDFREDEAQSGQVDLTRLRLDQSGDHGRREIHLAGRCGKPALIHHALEDMH
jgi:hypothetical protein